MYNYDRGGNITSKLKYAFTTGTLGSAQQTIPYVYGDSNWKDKLTSYNGQTITYDAIGNPLNDGTWTYTWNAGRQLKQMSKSGTTVQFKYDHNGLRVGKVVNGTETKYILHGKLVTHMTCGSDTLHFFYDAQSRPAKVSYNGVLYTYVHNLQGDVVGLLDNAGTLVVEYKYDAWGKPLSTTSTLADTLGRRNPFRYRGYIYDEEIELYYLRSRYYNQEWERFINADASLGNVSGLFSHALFTYCTNNPCSYYDRNGFAAVDITQVEAIAYELGYLDGPAPWGDILGVCLLAAASVYKVVADSLSTANTTIQEKNGEAPKKYRLGIAFGNNPVIAFGEEMTVYEAREAILLGQIVKNNVRQEYCLLAGPHIEGKPRVGIVSLTRNDAEELAISTELIYNEHPTPHIENGLPHFHILGFPDVHLWYVP